VPYNLLQRHGATLPLDPLCPRPRAPPCPMLGQELGRNPRHPQHPRRRIRLFTAALLRIRDELVVVVDVDIFWSMRVNWVIDISYCIFW
jgi:hypothetical protein